MSNHPSDPPPPYPGGYSTPSDYGFQGQPAPYPPGPQDQFNKGGNVPPASGYTSAQQPYGPATHQHTTVVVSQPNVTLVQTFRESPVRTRCNHCSAEVVTGIHYETGTFTWIICFVLWLVGCGLGCCLIPFCVDGCKDVIHTCPNCHQHIARFSRM